MFGPRTNVSSCMFDKVVQEVNITFKGANGEINKIVFAELVTHIVEAQEIWYFH